MERLTYKNEAGYHLKLEHEDADTVTALGLYEDTGLSPKEIEILRKDNLWLSAFCDLLVEELQEEERLEESGLLIRLPCKVGDTLWTAKWLGNKRTIVQVVISQMWFDDEMRLIIKTRNGRAGEIGKVYFHTREEARAALEKE